MLGNCRNVTMKFRVECVETGLSLEVDAPENSSVETTCARGAERIDRLLEREYEVGIRRYEVTVESGNRFSVVVDKTVALRYFCEIVQTQLKEK